MRSTLSRVDAGALLQVPGRSDGWRGVVEDYYELAKPRIIYLLLITTFAALSTTCWQPAR